MILIVAVKALVINNCDCCIEKELDMSKSLRKIAWILLAIEDILLLPCVMLSGYRLIEFCGADFHYAIWNSGFLGLILPIVFLRCFFLPYITLGIIIILLTVSLIIEKKGSIKTIGMDQKEKRKFFLAGIICLIGLLSVEVAFNGAMSV